MKQFYTLLTVFFTFPFLSSAQDLASNNTLAGSLGATEVPALAPQQWTKEDDQVNGHIASGKLSKMQHVTESIVNFFHDSCISDYRYSPIWHGEYYSEKASPGPRMKFGAVCNFYDQKASLQVLANDISPLLDHLVVNNQDFLTIRPVAPLKSDCPYFEYATTGAQGERMARTWLITGGNGQLPYTPVTRREYLTEARGELNGIRNSILAGLKRQVPVRAAAIQEAEKRAAIDQLNATYSGADLQVRVKMLLTTYKTDEEYLKENSNKATAGLDSTLHFMEFLLCHLSVAELNKPAIVSVQAADFRGFEDSHAGKMLIRINASYFNAVPAGEKPRFFLVSWSYDPSEPDAVVIDRLIQEKFDCQKLREMLGNQKR